MRMGVGTARRGWVEPGHVLNTRPAADVRAFIARKRAPLTHGLRELHGAELPRRP